MTPALALPWLLAALAALAMWRALVRARAEAWPRWRTASVLALQPLLALLLGLALLPPLRPAAPESLVLLTAGAVAPQILAPGERLLALPEAGDIEGATRVPDLATALRRHPGASRLRVLGDGLPARDEAATRALPMDFEPGTPPTGLVELDWPTRLPAGARFEVRGRLADAPGLRLELRDAAGRSLATTAPDAQGRFSLAASAGDPGTMAFELRLLGADEEPRQTQSLPFEALPGASHRLWLMSGAPNPELRALRRWALDAGLDLHTQMALGGGVSIGDGARPVNAATLAETDLLLLDERAWRALGPGGRAAVDAAVAEGMGLLLRLTGPLSAAEREALRAQGFVLEPGEGPRAVALPPALSPEASVQDPLVPVLSRWPDRLTAPGGGVLLADAAGEPLAAWQAQGAGRRGVWLLSDSFRWAQAGYPQAHARLWADAIATLARPRETTTLSLPPRAFAGERAALCGLAHDARLLSPDGTETRLRIDPATGAARCAAAWPTQPGWHRVRSAGTDQAWPVLAAEAMPGVRAQERREATQELAAFAPTPRESDTPPPERGPRWPWWLAWLAAAALAWALERRIQETGSGSLISGPQGPGNK